MNRQPALLTVADLDALITALRDDGFTVAGPQERDGAIVYDRLDGVVDLPRGWVDDQEGGRYRLRREGNAFFSHVVGPQSWKKYLHPPHQTLWRTTRVDGQTAIEAAPVAPEAYAFVGVRGCELAAIAVQDRVFGEGPFADPHYVARRRKAFIVAVNCGRAAATCFCPSMGTGPSAGPGFDVVLTEIDAGDAPAFVADSGSDRGRILLDRLSPRAASPEERAAASAVVEATEASIRRGIETDDLPRLLKDNPDHPRWDEVAARCLSCANCTMVCPTCFCTTVTDTSALDGSETSREQRWDSCFTVDFSHIHGGAVRPGAKSRYRQWMTHKLATWHDQFDMSGCTGCGRCITWCPVGIDITEEAAAIRASTNVTEDRHGN